MENRQYLMGSSYFFGCFKDFKSHDVDYIILEDNPKDYINVKNIRGRGQDIFYWRKMDPKEFIEITLAGKTPMQLGKFLIPEVVEAIGFTIEDLKLLEPLVFRLDNKHLYERIIYYSYINNNKFSLTNEQRIQAYQVYRKYRPETYRS